MNFYKEARVIKRYHNKHEGIYHFYVNAMKERLAIIYKNFHSTYLNPCPPFVCPINSFPPHDLYLKETFKEKHK